MLESFLRLITFRKTPTDLNSSDRRLAHCSAKETMNFIHDLFPLKIAPSANFDYAWLHRRLQRNVQRSKKNSLTEDFEDVQGNEIAALDPSQEPDEVLTRSSKPVA